MTASTSFSVKKRSTSCAKRTAKVAAALVSAHGGRDHDSNLTIALQDPVTRPAELFHLADLQYWNKDWTLARAGSGGAGGGMRGIRGITYLDGVVLATYPRDEIRGVVLSRSVTPGKHLSFTSRPEPMWAVPANCRSM